MEVQERKKKRLHLLIIILLLLLVGIAIFFIINRNSAKPPLQTDTNAVEYDGQKGTYRLPNGQAGIAIPGLPESLVFKANETTQPCNFFNPEGNDCLFMMTLYIDDKQMWQSGYVNAGRGYYTIELTEPIEAGEYPAYLFIQCYNEDGTELNKAKVETKIIASEVVN